MDHHPRALDTLIALVLAVAVLMSRGLAADTFVSWDEPMWAHRSARFLTALQDARWGDSLITGHPGVTTMWSGAFSLWWHSQVTGAISPETVSAAASMTAIDVHDAQQMRVLGELVPLAKRGTLLWHAALAFLAYLLLRRILARTPAIAAALAVFCNPFLLGLSRLLHLDALTAQFMLVAIIALLIYQRHRALVWLGVSGAAAGLAFATKTYALFVAPCALVMIGFAPDHTPEAGSRRWGRTATHLFLWGVAAWLTLLVIWPAAASQPVETLKQVFSMALGYASDPDTATSAFFLGEQTVSPGLLFYPLAYLFRATPVALLGTAAALLMLPWRVLWRGQEEQRRMVGALLLYALGYAALVSLSQKKYDRYLLPAILACDVAATVAWTRILEAVLALRRRSERSSAWAGALVSLGISVQAAALLAPLGPAHYLAGYNPLMGGLSRAVETLPVGWGEGLEEAVSWLQAQPDAADLTVAAWGVPGVAPLFDGTVIPPLDSNLHRADLVLVYISDVQDGEPIAERFAGREPVHVVSVNGQDYAWIYANDWSEELAPYWQAMSEPSAVVVSNDHSTLDRGQGDAPQPHVIGDDTEDAIAARLQQLVLGHDELWYLRFAVEHGRTQRITHQLAVEAVLLEEIPFAYGTLQRYALPSAPAFGRSQPETTIDAAFEGRVLLMSSAFHRAAVEHGRDIGVTLTWLAQGESGADLSIYLHLVDATGRRWSQTDELLQNDARETTSAWQSGSEQISRHTVRLPAGLAPGPYKVLVGLYSLAEGLTLLPVASDGTAHPAGVSLGAVTVEPATYPPSVDEVAVAERMEASLGPLRLIGYSPGQLQGRSGESLSLDLCWQCVQEMEADGQLQVKLTSVTPEPITMTVSLGSAEYPTNAWRPGDVICQAYELPLDAALPGGDYTLHLSLLDAHGMPVADAQEVALGTAEITHIARQMTAPRLAHPVRFGLGNACALVGIDWSQRDMVPGSPLELTFVWRSLAKTETDYAVFVQLLDAQGRILSQVDAQPVFGTRPTSGWLPGEYITDSYELTVPADAATGLVEIIVGMYDPSSLVRLPIRGMARDHMVDDAIQLPGQFRIVSGGEEG